jgi:hypothetical protein
MRPSPEGNRGPGHRAGLMRERFGLLRPTAEGRIPTLKVRNVAETVADTTLLNWRNRP